MTLPHDNNAPRFPESALKAATSVRLLALDVDGVLTDGGIYIGDQGEMFKRFNSQDGLGIRLLQRAGIDVCIITGRSSQIVLQRAAELSVGTVLQGCKNKRDALEQLAQDRGLKSHEVAFAGDDLPDLPAMDFSGFAVAVANAHTAVLAKANWTTSRSGGAGAVRELCDLILVAQNKSNTTVDDYSG